MRPPTPLSRIQHWIFDLDGTLTRPVHDFEAIRRQLGIPSGQPILEHLQGRPEPERSELTRELDAIEARLAQQTRVAAGAESLLRALRARGARLGIVTRNSRDNARRTLQTVGLWSFFTLDEVIGRDQAEPKPSPAGIAQLSARWRVAPSACVMVGDFRYDLEAGRNAGTATVLVDASARYRFAELADHCVRRLDELLEGPGV